MLKADTPIIKADVANKNGTEYFALVSLVPSEEAIGKMKMAAIVKKGTRAEIKENTTQTPAMMPRKAIL